MNDWPWTYCPVCRFDVIPREGRCSRRKKVASIEGEYEFLGHRLDDSKRPLNGLIPELLRADVQFMKWLKETGGIEASLF